jgi:hypothetical protein
MVTAYKPITLLLILFLSSYSLRGQALQFCDAIIQKPEKEAVYRGGRSDLFVFFERNIIPILTRHGNSSKLIPDDFGVIFTVNNRGSVVQAKVDKGVMSDSCKREVIAQFSRMTGWKAAQDKGLSVCSTYRFYVNCLLWAEDE